MNTTRLVDFSIALNDDDQNDEEILYEAIRNNEIDVIKEFIKQGFNIEKIIQRGWTILMHACYEGKPDIVEYLLNEGADPKKCFQRLTPLMSVCISDSFNEDELLQCIDLLLKYDIDINARDKQGRTAFILAVQENRKKIIDKLIGCRCNMNVQDYEGKNALFYAVLKGKKDIVKRLVDSEVKLNLIDSDYSTAYDIAITKGFHEIAQLVMTEEDKKYELSCETLQKNERKYTREPIESILNQLPSRNGNLDFSGFPSDVESLLGGMEMIKFRDCFVNSNIQLGELLTITDQRLKEIGIKFSVQRQHILYCVQKFHLRPWNKLSLGYTSPNLPETLESGILLLANTVKHLHILKATTQYVRHEIQRPVDEKIYECISKALEELKSADCEINQIRSFALDLDKKEELEPSDIIKPKKCDRKITQSVSVLVLGTLIVGGLIWKSNKRFNFIHLKLL